MQNLFERVWENLLARTEGPLNLRFVIQPILSLIFAVRAGRRDAKNDQAPYLWKFIFSAGRRTGIAAEAWKDVGKLFITGTIMDIIYQLISIYGTETEDRFYPLESLIVAFILAIIPYILVRGPINRLIRLFIKKDNSTGQ